MTDKLMNQMEHALQEFALDIQETKKDIAGPYLALPPEEAARALEEDGLNLLVEEYGMPREDAEDIRRRLPSHPEVKRDLLLTLLAFAVTAEANGVSDVFSK